MLKKINKILKKTANENLIADLLKKEVSVRSDNKIILIQAIEDLYHYTIFRIIFHHISKKLPIQINLCLFRTIIDGETKNGIVQYVKSRFIARLLNIKWRDLYSAYCPIIGINALKINCYDFVSLFKAFKLWMKIIGGSSVLSLKINNIYVGDLINDTYIRYKPNYYVNVKDFYLFIIIWNACKYINSADKFFSRNKVKLFLVAYSTYIQHGIYVRVALNFNIPVYSFGNYQNFSKKLTNDDWFHTKCSTSYHAEFLKLDQQTRDELLLQSKKMLENRINGGIDSATAYMRKSAYIETEKFDLDLSGGLVIFLHDFYDSPHVFYDLVFPNFWEWACFTIDTLKNNQKKFFVKIHPNQIGLSSEVVTRLLQKYPDLEIIPQNITNLQLVKAGIKVGVTVYGTVSHELAFLGVPSICSARHPHISFDFCVTAKTKDEYRKFLLDENISKLSIDELRQQSLIFYAMHNLNISPDEIELKNQLTSLRSLLSDTQHVNEDQKLLIKKVICSISENYYLKNFIDEILEKEEVQNVSA